MIIGKVAQFTVDDRKIVLEIDAAARNWLADKGYDPAYGARPLKRAIQKYLQDPLAEQILAGNISDGDSVSISAGEGALIINGTASEAVAA